MSTSLSRKAGPLIPDSVAWILPRVDVDVAEFHSGEGPLHAWAQTSGTLFVFARVSNQADGEKPNIELELLDEGTRIRLTVGGTEILNGQLAHALVPGTELWMIEESTDGIPYVVVEIDKSVPGREWNSLLSPVTRFLPGYSTTQVEKPEVSIADQNAVVLDVLEHLRIGQAKVWDAPEGHKAKMGDVLVLNVRGFQLGPDGQRGDGLNASVAEGLRVVLGSDRPEDAGLPVIVHNQLIAIGIGESRDVQVLLGSQPGEILDKTIVCEVTCAKIQHRDLPDLDDEFARAVKREERLLQAGTEEGIPENERGLVETFTLDQLKSDIFREISYHSQAQSVVSMQSSIEENLISEIEVFCDWATPKTEDGGLSAKEDFIRQETLAAIFEAVADREDLRSLVDIDSINRKAWEELGIPKKGKNIAEVGKDPARDFQESYRKVFRSHLRDVVTKWFIQRATLTKNAPSI